MVDREIKLCSTGRGRNVQVYQASTALRALAVRLTGVEEGRKLYKVLLEKIRLAKEAREKAQLWYDEHISTCTTCGREVEK